MLPTVFILFGAFFQFPSLVFTNKCVWYGQKRLTTGQTLNVKYDGPPKLANAKSLQLLRTQCPHLLSNNETFTCCDEQQIQELINRSAPIRSILGRCKPCVYNFNAYFCEFTCSPKQANFLKSTSVTQDGLIDAIEYYVYRPFVDAVINSCRDVSYSSGGQKGLNFICGSSACDSQLLIQTFSKEKFKKKELLEVVDQFSSMAPFKTVVKLDKSNESMRVERTHACNQTSSFLNLTLEPCACLDCSASCSRSCSLESLKSYKKVISLVTAFIGFIILVSLCTSLLFQYARNQARRTTVATERTTFLPELAPNDKGRLSKFYARLSLISCRFPILSIMQALVICSILAAGIRFMETTTDPNVIWSVRKSKALANANHFKATFKEPFVRTTQLILIPKDKDPWFHFVENDFFGVPYSSVFKKEYLAKVFELEREIEKITVSNTRLDALCSKPLAPLNENCTILSVTQYFQRNVDLLEKAKGEPNSAPSVDFATHIAYCIDSPFSMQDPTFEEPCIGDFGGAVEPSLVLGSSDDPRLSRITNTTSLIITIPLSDDASVKEQAMDWEEALLNFLANNVTDFPFEIRYSTERSIEDEIKRESWTDVRTLIISYFLMFIYVLIALTLTTIDRAHRCSIRHILVHSKLTVAFMSVTFVILSVVASVGLFAWLKVPTTLLIFEVVPFLILAVGVDNVFIIVQSSSSRRLHPEPEEDLEKRISLTMSEVGPGIAVSALAELSAFACAALLARQYAIRLFALYAFGALAFNIYIQSTALIALIALDCRRVAAQRSDVFYCHLPPTSSPHEHEENDEDDTLVVNSNVHHHHRHEDECIIAKFSNIILYDGNDDQSASSSNSILRSIILIAFSVFFVACLTSLASMKVGLDPKTSLPRDSYLSAYLEAVQNHLQLGPPFFVVVSSANKANLNLANLTQQNKICAAKSCNSHSLMNKLIEYSKCPTNVAFVGTAPSSWIDAYIDWHFLADIPEAGKCTLGGHALFAQSVLFNDLNQVAAFNMRGFHSPLKTSSDFIEALRRSEQFTAELQSILNDDGDHDDTSIKVYIHSVFYVFYEQYLSIFTDTAMNIGIPLLIVFLIVLICTKFAWLASLAFMVSILMILVDVGALMVFMGIELNAISLVNIVMSIGIAVEFCAHLTMQFVCSTNVSSRDRAHEALKSVGSSIFTGVALTKLTGIAVLAFAKSELFSLYFFKIYAVLIVMATVHSLIFLPCLLSTIKTHKPAPQPPTPDYITAETSSDHIESEPEI